MTYHATELQLAEGSRCGTGGGGPKAALLETMIAEEQLESRVRMVGAVPHEQARNVLVCHHLLAPDFGTEALLCCAVLCCAALRPALPLSHGQQRAVMPAFAMY